MIKVLVVDDHPVVRDGLGALLETQPDIEVVGEAGDGPEAVALASALQPDVILIDMNLPTMDGAEATLRIRSGSPSSKVLIFSACSCSDFVYEALKAGASGYIVKGAPRQEILQSVRVVAAGGTMWQPQQLALLVNRPDTHAPPYGSLTDREQEVLHLVVQGLRNKEIADALGIAERTVKFHTNLIFQKLGVTSRSEAVALAIKQRLVS